VDPTASVRRDLFSTAAVNRPPVNIWARLRLRASPFALAQNRRREFIALVLAHIRTDTYFIGDLLVGLPTIHNES